MAQIQRISISKIRRNPDNPRKVFNPNTIEQIAASMREVGQKTAVKVRRLTTDEQTIASPHEYELIGGERRWQAAPKAGLDTLDAIVLDITPEQVHQEAYLDNQNEEMFWLDRYQSIERFLNAPSNVPGEKV